MSAPAPAPRLRPLGIGEILDVGIKIYTRNAPTLFKIVVFVVLPAQIVVNAVETSALPKGVTESSGGFFGPDFRSSRTSTVSNHQLEVFLVGYVLALLIGWIASQLAQAGCFRAVADAYLGEQVGWRSSLRYAMRRLPALIVLSIVSTILIGIGSLFCFIPGIYLFAAFYVAVPALLVEGSGPFRSLGRSRELVQGRWWGTFGVAVVGYVLVSIVTFAITGLIVGLAFANPDRNTVTGFALNTLAATLGSMLSTPAAAAFATVLYIDLRVRKEGFDLLLLARRLGVERDPGQELPSYLPETLQPTNVQPPFWPPPPGWTPEPVPFRPTPPQPPPPAESTQSGAAQPSYWPPPPGWTPEPASPRPPPPPPAQPEQSGAARPPIWPPPPGWTPDPGPPQPEPPPPAEPEQSGASQPPFWPPPAGWTPDPTPSQPEPTPPDESEQSEEDRPPYWPPPPGEKPERS